MHSFCCFVNLKVPFTDLHPQLNGSMSKDIGKNYKYNYSGMLRSLSVDVNLENHNRNSENFWVVGEKRYLFRIKIVNLNALRS